MNMICISPLCVILMLVIKKCKAEQYNIQNIGVIEQVYVNFALLMARSILLNLLPLIGFC